MGFSRRLSAWLFLACFCWMPRPAVASTVIFRTDAQLVALSERVVHGRVVAKRTTRGGPQGLRIYTVTTLQIIEDLTGVDGDTVEVWELGGAVDGEYMHVGGAVEFRLGEEVLVCLERGPQGLRTVAMGFSKFDVLPAVNGERSLRRNLRETNVVGGLVTRAPFLSEFRALTARATGRPSRPGRSARAGDELQSVEQPFTLLGGATTRSDGCRPTRARRSCGTSTPARRRRSRVVTLPPSSRSRSRPGLPRRVRRSSFSMGARRFSPMPRDRSPAWPAPVVSSPSKIRTTNSPDRSWRSAEDRPADPGGTVNGTTFYAFSRGYVIFQNAADLSSSFRTPPNFTRVLIHEIGHAIGLGHTQTDGSVANATSNIMYPSCCGGATPLPPAIGPDDLAGLNFVYPSSSTCTYSINPTSASVAGGSGSGTVTVSTQAGCSWNASSGAAFLGISSGSSGTGSGSVGYTIVANPSASPRSGALTIAGQTFTVNQAAAACSYSISPGTASAPASRRKRVGCPDRDDRLRVGGLEQCRLYWYHVPGQRKW